MKAKQATRKGEAGLSTLEALVAVAVLGITLLPILSFQSQITRAYQRYQAQYARTAMQHNAMAVLRDMNPMETPQGSITLGTGQTMTWSAAQLTDNVQNVGFPVGDGEFSVALYKVTARVEDKDLNLVANLTVDRLGWRKSVRAFTGE